MCLGNTTINKHYVRLSVSLMNFIVFTDNHTYVLNVPTDSSLHMHKTSYFPCRIRLLTLCKEHPYRYIKCCIPSWHVYLKKYVLFIM